LEGVLEEGAADQVVVLALIGAVQALPLGDPIVKELLVVGEVVTDRADRPRLDLEDVRLAGGRGAAAVDLRAKADLVVDPHEPVVVDLQLCLGSLFLLDVLLNESALELLGVHA